jgi:transcriptional regulator with XRE-family HTH domain
MAIHRQLILCSRVRGLRERAGLSQSEVAKVLHISQAAYCRLERGEIEMTLTRILALGELYKVSLTSLLDGV